MVRSAETTFRAFRESLVDCLSDGCCRIESTEMGIKERVQALVHMARDKAAVSIRLGNRKGINTACAIFKTECTNDILSNFWNKITSFGLFKTR